MRGPREQGRTDQSASAVTNSTESASRIDGRAPTVDGVTATSPTGNPLALLPTLEGDLARVETEIMASVESDLDFMTEISQHLIKAKGKRVRPGFAIAAAATANKDSVPVHHDVIMAGVSVELIHIGSLYHDDVMDQATTRRSVESVNARWGNLKAILAGDYLLGQSSEIAAGLGTDVAALMAQTISKLCEGQIRELQDNFNVDRTPEDYIAAIEGKTASLLATACRVGAMTGGLDSPMIESLTEFGYSYGMAFQVVDDILDVVATDEQLGKPSGNDILEGNYSLPVIRALRSDVGPQLRSLLTAFIDEDERDQALVLIRTSPGVAEALDVARAYADKAAASLTSLADNAAGTALRAAADHLISKVSNPLI